MSIGNSITRRKYGLTYRQFLRPKLDSLKITDSINFVGSRIQPPDNVLEFDSLWTSYRGSYLMLEGDIQHEGYGVYTIADLLELPVLNKIREYNPDIVLLLAGTNDLPINYEEALSNLGKLIDSVLVEKKSFLLVSTIPPRLDNQYNEHIDVILFNSELPGLIENYQKENHNVLLVDTRSKMNVNSMHEDGIHPNEKGHKEIAEAFLRGSGILFKNLFLFTGCIFLLPNRGSYYYNGETRVIILKDL